MYLRLCRTIPVSFFMVATVLLMVGCEHSQGIVTPPRPTLPPLSDIQLKILTPKCAIPGCHVPGGAAPMSLQTGVSFGTLVNVTSTGYAPRQRVTPNNSANSVLFLKVTGNAATASRMPLGSTPLSQADISAIQQWIDTGALNN